LSQWENTIWLETTPSNVQNTSRILFRGMCTSDVGGYPVKWYFYFKIGNFSIGLSAFPQNWRSYKNSIFGGFSVFYKKTFLWRQLGRWLYNVKWILLCIASFHVFRFSKIFYFFWCPSQTCPIWSWMHWSPSWRSVVKPRTLFQTQTVCGSHLARRFILETLSLVFIKNRIFRIFEQKCFGHYSFKKGYFEILIRRCLTPQQAKWN